LPDGGARDGSVYAAGLLDYFVVVNVVGHSAGR
jgi:hypothetical protein